MDFKKIALGILILFFGSCTKNLDNYGPQSTNPENPEIFLNRAIVLNEGNFMAENEESVKTE